MEKINTAKAFELSKVRQRRIAVAIILSLIILFYIASNLLWGMRSPVYFYRDSIMNINWAVYYAKAMRGEGMAYRPDLIRILKDNDIIRDYNIYYSEAYSDVFMGPIGGNERIEVGDLFKLHHPPAWFLFLGSLFALFGFKVYVIYLAQSILGAVALWAMYVVGKRMHSSSLGLFSAFLLSTLHFFLFVTRQGFIETMLYPVVIMSFMLCRSILTSPSKLGNYFFLGAIFGFGMLIKASYAIFIIIFFIVLAFFLILKRSPKVAILRNVIISAIVMAIMALPYYSYVIDKLWPYAVSMFVKGETNYYFSPADIFGLFFILKTLLGQVLTVVFIFTLVYSLARPRLPLSFLAAFVAFGCIFTISLPLSLNVRHYTLFLPFIILLICRSIMDMGSFKKIAVASLVVFGLVRGYGWLMPHVFKGDSMEYLYDEIGTKDTKQGFHVYPRGVEYSNPFFSFAPLPPLDYRTVYDIVRGIEGRAGLKVVNIISSGAPYKMETKGLAGALSLYSLIENVPLIIEGGGAAFRHPFKDRVWIIARGRKDAIDKSRLYKERNVDTRYVDSVFLSPTIICDIFIEGG
ncbi:MAG: glycosyltransferase family 39 protein [Candidatus Omnitrophica bacterium]|nr:glycosyltransferase family 39 protein [Candidatus Omnitrophota bacterium]